MFRSFSKFMFDKAYANKIRRNVNRLNMVPNEYLTLHSGHLFARSYVRTFVRSDVRTFGRSDVRTFGRSRVRVIACSRVRVFACSHVRVFA